MLKDKSLITVWSNFPFLLPAALAVTNEQYLYGLLITVSALASLIHHMDNGVNIKLIDQLFALTIISANLYVLHLSGWLQPYFGVALAFVVLAFYFFFKGKSKNYDIYHGLWHLCSAVITLMCVIAYSAA